MSRSHSVIYMLEVTCEENCIAQNVACLWSHCLYVGARRWKGFVLVIAVLNAVIWANNIG